MGEEIEKIKILSEPFMEHLGGENVCTTNIEKTISSVSTILAEIKETDTIITSLKSKYYEGTMTFYRSITADADKFLETMERAKQLHLKFEGDLIYFKDSFAISQKLVKLSNI